MTRYAFKRSERLSDLLRETISSLLLTDVKDPRVQQVTITHVEISEDLQNAKVYFRALSATPLSKKAIAELEQAMEQVSGYLKHHLGKMIRMKKLPQFLFLYDLSLENHDRIQALLRQVENEST